MPSPTITVPTLVLWKGGFVIFILALPLILFYAKQKEWKKCCGYLTVGLIGLFICFHEEITGFARYAFWSLT
ncbi:hypothetical protein [Bacillus cereus]|uniref:hypothetical protein n=1 Tax=Bacillus cereus TaxID=1396 RepID=UPI000951A0B4|nr:hypothetical protein [Bacillus cereus]OLR25068.1 hypothetical protein BLD50_14165 [Bacillus cereus]